MSGPAAPVQAAPPRPVRFGILGCADIARKFSRALLMLPPGAATVAAIGSRSEDKARRFIAETGLPAARPHGSYESFLGDADVEAVYLPLPTSLHVPWATAAAARGKHLLLEKPTALCAADLDAILAACDASGVQFMDTTMWIHNPRTAKMREIVADKDAFGDIRVIHSMCGFRASEYFLQNDIRVKPDLDALGVLGDVGWYSIRSILWAVEYELPETVIAHCHPVKNQAGVILACGATLYWADGKTATFNCSFLTNLAFDVTVYGTHGTLHVTDLVIPYEEKYAEFSVASKSNFVKPTIGWDPLPSKHVVTTDLPQEALMVQEFSRLVQNIRDAGGRPEGKWPAITRKTQVVLDAVKASIDKGSEPVEVAS
ncbi:oxidoreductase [Panicum miliaceum]|uniref:Oxidoreductase n=1 Tax=Panicum miliaceum TaxID=4540 RepID=A0A3L6SAG8_PANMI|nr:oxidoreductase [Panicum miliaceum]